MKNPLLKIGLGILAAMFALISYCNKGQINPVTGEKQWVSLTPQQEVALGLQSTPQMVAEFGGEYPDAKLQQYVSEVGNKLVTNTEASKSSYQFGFHLLNDSKTINAFALPGGQIFITYALISKLENEDQLAGVLGHEIGHVIARHGSQHMAKQELTQGLVGAAQVALSDPNNPNASAAIAQYVGNFINLKYGRNDELQSDKFGVKYMYQCGYKPEEMIGVMEILKAASGGGSQSDFMSTHPNPENRIEHIKEEIALIK